MALDRNRPKPTAATGDDQAQQQKVATPEKQVALPAEQTPEEKIRDAATVKKTMTPAQLALNDLIVNSIGMVLVPLPAGQFEMGSPTSEPGRENDDETQHLVKITKPFYLSVYEVTQQQYKKVMGTRAWQSRSVVQEGSEYAASFIHWSNAVEFCNKLSEKEGVEYRLPTEAEWEYACRAGTTSAYSFGDDASKLGQYAWYDENAWDIGEEYAHHVGQKLPNLWGLYDMHGNVWEWCWDRYEEDYANPAVDVPSGPESEYRHVLRGGSVTYPANYCRSAARNRAAPDYRYCDIGFRVARTYKAETPAAAKTPGPAAVKQNMTPEQLELGDPIVNSIGMVLVPIPAGEFQMGSPDSDNDAKDNEKPQHLVKITKPFYLSVFEVTQQQYAKVMGVCPWQGKKLVKDGLDYPATYVSWHEAVEFCHELSEREGVEYCLATEAQWEYACRAGTTTAYSFGDDVSKLKQHAWYRWECSPHMDEEYAHRRSARNYLTRGACTTCTAMFLNGVTTGTANTPV